MKHFLRPTAATLVAALAAAVLLVACGRRDAGDAAAGASTTAAVAASAASMPNVTAAMSTTATATAPAASAAPLVHDGGAVMVPAGSALRTALELVPARERPLERSFSVPAAIEPDPARVVKVAPPVGGRVLRLYKRLGDPVRVGEPLAEIDSPDLAQATADASKAESALRLADRAYARQHELADAEIAARKDVEQAESDREQAQSEVRRARGRLAQLGVVAGHGNGHQYTLDSPIAGHVIDMTGAQGGFWNDTTAPLLTVGDLSTVWVAASVAEKDLAAVAVGETVRIALSAYPDAAPLDGRVARIGQVLDADTRTVKVRIELDNAAGRLRPGMFASVAFHAAPHRALVVPASALLQDGLATRVWVEHGGPWRFESRAVETGAQVGDDVEIVRGLAAGERVVGQGAVLLND